MIIGNIESYVVGNHSRIGNLLFLMSTCFALSKKYDTEFIFPLMNQYYESWGECYKNTIFRNIPCGNSKSDIIYNDSLDYDCYSYKEIKTDFTKNIELNGYFMSYKYFDEYSENIKELFYIDNISFDYISKKYSELLNSKSVSVHIRRGDFKKKKINENHILFRLDSQYYVNSMKYINEKIENPIYYFFMENNDDKHWIKKYILSKIENIQYKFINNEKDYIDIYMMSLCKHNIIANSTFSWWGAYLNNNTDKIIIRPNNWLPKQHDNDHFPTSWIPIEIV